MIEARTSSTAEESRPYFFAVAVNDNGGAILFALITNRRLMRLDKNTPPAEGLQGSVRLFDSARERPRVGNLSSIYPRRPQPRARVSKAPSPSARVRGLGRDVSDIQRRAEYPTEAGLRLLSGF